MGLSPTIGRSPSSVLHSKVDHAKKEKAAGAQSTGENAISATSAFRTPTEETAAHKFLVHPLP